VKTKLAVAATLAALVAGTAGAQAPAADTKPTTATFAQTCRVDMAQPQARLTGKVTDQAGAPLPGASLSLACGAFHRTARSVGDGTYSFSAPAGTYQVEIEAPGFLPWAETVVLKAAGASERACWRGPLQQHRHRDRDGRLRGRLFHDVDE
jgi:iron complex outermembrane receptor protein